MPRFFFETDAGEPCPLGFAGPDDVLVYFLSLAFSTRYGSQHPLSRLSLLLRGEFGVDMKPLTTFASREVEEPADAEELERVWQDASPLARSVRGVLDAIDIGDPRIAGLMEDAPGLRDRLADLAAMAEWAVGRNARVRMTFEL